MTVQTWSNWKRFPNAESGDHIEAPIGPGVYEVCDASTREQIAFGCTTNVANTLSTVLTRGTRKMSLLPWRRRSGHETLEYRAWPTATLSDAKIAVGQILDKRGAMMRRFAQTVRV